MMVRVVSIAMASLVSLGCSATSSPPLTVENVVASRGDVEISVSYAGPDYKAFLDEAPGRTVVAYLEPCEEHDRSHVALTGMGEWSIRSDSRSLGDLVGAYYIARVKFGCGDEYTQLVHNEVV